MDKEKTINSIKSTKANGSHNMSDYLSKYNVSSGKIGDLVSKNLIIFHQ